MDGFLLNFLLLSLVLLFGIINGLSLGLNKLNKKKVIVNSTLYSFIILIFSILSTFFSKYLFSIFNNYIHVIIGFLGLSILFMAIIIIKKSKNVDNYSNNYLFTKFRILAIIISIIGLFSTYNLLNKPLNTNFLLFLGIAFLFFILTSSLAVFSNFLKRAKKPYPILYGNIMILISFIFLTIAMFLPYVETLDIMNASPFSIKSSFSLLFLLTSTIGLLFVGSFLTAEGHRI